MTEELRRAVALKICMSLNRGLPEHLQQGEPDWGAYLPEADAAIAAVREALAAPTPKMVADGQSHMATFNTQNLSYYDRIFKTWQAMLAASPIGDTGEG